MLIIIPARGDRPGDLNVAIWFPAVLRVSCAYQGCEQCQEIIETKKLPLVVPGIGI